MYFFVLSNVYVPDVSGVSTPVSISIILTLASSQLQQQ